MTKQLWAPWRMDYIKTPRSSECVFCSAAEAEGAEAQERLVLAKRTNEFVVINRYPYNFGHILICPNRHVSCIEDLSTEEQQTLFATAIDAQVALKKSLSPHGLNWGINVGKEAGAGIESHLHIHIVPRWIGDTNFMPVTADTHVMPGHLDELYETLRKEFIEFEK